MAEWNNMKRLVLHIYIMFMALTAMACQSNEVEATPSDKSANTMNITINGKTVRASSLKIHQQEHFWHNWKKETSPTRLMTTATSRKWAT